MCLKRVSKHGVSKVTKVVKTGKQDNAGLRGSEINKEMIKKDNWPL